MCSQTWTSVLSTMAAAVTTVSTSTAPTNVDVLTASNWAQTDASVMVSSSHICVSYVTL